MQWIVDSNEYNAERYPPSEAPDLFGHWNLGALPVVGNVVEEPPWWEQSELVARAAWQWQERLQCAIEGCGDTAELDAVRRCRLTSG